MNINMALLVVPNTYLGQRMKQIYSSREPRQPLVIFGAGGHAKTVIPVVHAMGCWDIVGLVVDFIENDTYDVMGCPVLLGQDQFLSLRETGVKHAFIAIGENALRQKISKRVTGMGFELVNIVHPTALVMQGAMLEDGIFLNAYSIVGSEVKIARGVIAQPYVTVGHESQVGAYCQLSPGVRIGGACRIGERCFFGPNSVVYPKISIGDSAAVGANSVVNKDLFDCQTIVVKASRIISHSMTKDRG